ncbi:MAG: Fe-S protein assembly co-chaperone HscB [Proteobacteria bacterium]|nr:Fe-S protein assembly co-chaperone HscB [Pseudomonadota bacterium]
MTTPDFQQSYFQLFSLPRQFALDNTLLGERFRQLQGQLHPDRFASKSAHEQRIAVQYSAFVNQAYTTLRRPLDRAFYLLQLAGMSAEEVSAEKIDGGFLIEQMELREKLESIADLVEPETVLEHLILEIAADIKAHEQEFVAAFTADDISGAASACVKMQYLGKLHREAEQIESGLLD